MAKKFGKTLLLSAAVISAAAAVYFYLQKKDAAEKESEEEDYDDFSEDLNNESSESSRNYVPLNQETSTQQAENAQDTTEGVSEEASSAETPSGESSAAEPSRHSVEDFPIHSKETEKASNNTFTPLTEQAAQAAENTASAVEEFFDEEDGPGIEPPINDH